MDVNIHDRFRDKFADFSVSENYIVFQVNEDRNQYLLRSVQTDKTLVRSKEELETYFIKET